MEKTKYELADVLIEMWDYALLAQGNTLTHDQYHELKIKFLLKLGEFEEKVKEECW